MEKKNNLGLILSSVLFVCTVCVFGPLELYCTNLNEFWFAFSDTLIIVFISAGISAAVLGLIGLLLRGKARDAYGMLIFLVSVALYIQGNYANINYGVLDGKAIDWSQYTDYAILDTMGWLLLIGGGIFLFIRKKPLFATIQKAGSAFIIAIEIVTLAVLFITSSGDLKVSKGEAYLSTDGIYSVGEKENIIIFILDACDDKYFQLLLEESDEYEKEFADFVHFDNCATAAATTKAGVPAIITGKAYPGTIDYSKYISEAYDSDGLYSLMQKQNYDIRFYTESMFIPDSSNADNMVNSSTNVNSYPRLAEKFEQLTLFRYVPHIFKPFFWMYSGELDSFKEGHGGTIYSTDDDVAFYSNLVESGLDILPNKNAFRLFHLRGSHPPYNYNRLVERQENSSVLEQTRGAFQIIMTYMSWLKELNLYDNTTFIIMADHGNPNPEYDINSQAHAVLLYKEKQQKGTELQNNASPVSYWDLHATLFKELGEDIGPTFFDAQEENRIRTVYYFVSQGNSYGWQELLVRGNLNEDYSIQETGKTLMSDIDGDSLYPIGKVIKFGSAIEPKYIITGVSNIDMDTWSWTDGYDTILHFSLATTPRKNILLTITLFTAYTRIGPQSVYLYANRVLCGQKMVSSEKELQFIIPGFLINNEKELELHLFLPDAVCPKVVFGAGNDERTLALALSSICLEETEQEAVSVAVPQLLPDISRSFTAQNSEGNEYFLFGLSTPEQKFTWTDGKTAVMEALLPEQVEGNLLCRFKLASIFGDEQTVIVTNCGRELFHEVLKKDAKEFEFVIPAEYLDSGTLLHLNMELPNAISPQEAGAGSDERLLGLALKEMIVMTGEPAD